MNIQSNAMLSINPDSVGILGVVFTLIAYFLLQINKIKPTGLSYSLLNISGAALILYSLFFHWNTSAFIMEFTWLLISLYGLTRYIINHNAKINKKNV